ncbi:quinon protein alcohol dehydrogenase-like superfamily [Hypomontagnella submonticulosa]|nr:quinon protein alcohol dehydrogenase-like superfamily [Hypomontagnella submonticulosa]
MAMNHVGYLQAENASRVHIGNNYNHNEPSLNQCLIDLRLTNPADDKARIERQKGGLLEDACSWILSHSDFVKWRHNKTSQLLWIKGDPGKGKTMLLCGIINELGGIPNDGCILSYFFCQATDQNLNSATAVLRGLMYMLASQDRSLLEHVYEEYKTAGRRLFEDSNAWDALSRIFTIMLQEIDPGKSLILIIDALDECEKGTAQLIRLIIQHSVTNRVKWIVSSRNLLNIEEPFKGGNQVMLCLELNKESISSAVSIYIQRKVQELSRVKDYDSRTQNNVKSYLLSHANATFLWVALICQRLRDPDVQSWKTTEELQSFPSGLDSLYELMARYIDGSINAYLCYKVLAVMLITYRPITLQELACLVSWPEGFEANLKSMGTLVKLCGSFLTFQDGVVRFIHQSANEFLQRNERASKIFPSGIAHAHHTVFLQSIRAMLVSLRRDMYHLQRPDFEIHDDLNITPPDPDPLGSSRYSCEYWVPHFDASCFGKSKGQVDLDVNDIILAFLSKHYLHWLESLCLIGSVPEGITAMSRLFQLTLGSTGWSRLTHLVVDAKRFIEHHQTLIEKSPLQVYTAALIFSPRGSIIKNLFQGEEQKWFTTNGASEFWNTHLQGTCDISTSDSTQSIAFSRDSSLVALAISEMVEIRRVDSGELQRKLEGNWGYVGTIAFSHDSKLLAGASTDPAIQIWSVKTGILERVLRGHTDYVGSVSFSPDSKLIVSGSWDKTVRIWSVADGTQQAIINHTQRVYSVAFSPDAKLIASGSYCGTVRVWPTAKPTESGFSRRTGRLWPGTKAGNARWMLDGHQSAVLSITFSPDSQLIASGSYDGVVKIWLATGTLQRTILTSGCLLSVAFSPCSKSISVALSKGAIKVYSTVTGIMRHTIRAPFGPASAAAFSHDLEVAAFGTPGPEVRICGTGMNTVNIGQEYHDPRGPAVDSIVFSPTSTHFVSASWCNTVQVWSTDTGECLQSIDADTKNLELRFSHDGQCLYLHYCVQKHGIAIPKSSPRCSRRCKMVNLDLRQPAVKDVARRSTMGSLDQALEITGSDPGNYWVGMNGKRLLRLPSHCSRAISGSTLVLALHTGKVVTIWFSAEVLKALQ